MGNYTTVFTTNQIITQLTTSWGGVQQGSTETWGPGPISYSINTGVPPRPVGAGGEQVGQQNMTSTQVALAQLSFQLWADLIPRQFINAGTSPTANITLNYSSTTQDGGTYAADSTTSPRPSAAKTFTFTSDRIWLANSSDWPDSINPTINNYGLTTMVHEVGHALGLSHPGAYNAAPGVSITYTADAQFSQDTREYSIMSYFGVYVLSRVDYLGNLSPGEGWTTGTIYKGDVVVYAQTPMVYDIAAIQKLYGANMTTRTGDTVYGFHCNVGGAEQAIYDFSLNKTPIFTIWDAGGNNTIDGSLCTSAQTINLTPGSYSNIDGMTQNVAIAFNCIIQNAIGGDGNDTLIGGNLGNVFSFTGGKGNDTIIGGAVGISTSNYSSIFRDYTVTITGNNATVQDNTANRDGTDSLTNIQRLHFTNVNDAIDIAANQNAGEVYMLYQAAFNRAADLGGMGYWLAQVDKGVNIITGIAQSFINTAEFIAKYGVNPTNVAFVNELYQNVLHRAGDAGGIAFWDAQLNNGTATKASVLEGFASSTEGAALVAQTISHGIQYTLYVG